MSEDISERLHAVVKRRLGTADLTGLTRLSGGASRETWSFDAAGRKLILRRVPPALSSRRTNGIALETEADLQIIAMRHGIPVPEIVFLLEPEDRLGAGYVMSRVAGETIARKILRDAEFADVRPRLAAQCGAILRHLHAIPIDTLPALRRVGAHEQLAEYRVQYDLFDEPHPIFEFAFRWLETHLPEPVAPKLVHGDFRNGNLVVSPHGVASVLDWELAHLGDPYEDLAWICINSWRFGELDKPVGGFGPREDFYAAYGQVDVKRARFWEILSTLKWGVICMMQCAPFIDGSDRSVERAAIGRRASETELDLMLLLG